MQHHGRCSIITLSLMRCAAALSVMMLVTDTSLAGAVRLPPDPIQGTHADYVEFPGPDGVIYPDFTFAGIQGGIPDVQGPVFDVTAYGAIPDDEGDDAPAIQATVEAAGQAGGGVVLLPPGTYHLDEFIRIEHDNIVIRGSGRSGGAMTRVVARRSSQRDVGVFTIKGGVAGGWLPFGRPGRRGDMTVTLADEKHGVRVGQVLWLSTQPPAEFDNRYDMYSIAHHEAMLSQYAIVTGVDGAIISLSEPLRLDMPLDRNSRARVRNHRVNCGIESLRLETLEGATLRGDSQRDTWLNGIHFDNAADCWVRDVHIEKAGKNPVNFYWCFNIEIRDCVFNDAWHKGAGGTGYVGFWHVRNGLMENVTTYDMRHAPNLQDGASGCVIRNSSFHGSDAQWHTNWTHHNLFDNVRVEKFGGDRMLMGSTSIGQLPEGEFTTQHTVHGPRNVVYHCDLSAVDGGGIRLGGLNIEWIFAHNRVVIRNEGYSSGGSGLPAHIHRGPLVMINDGCRDLLFINNVFASENRRQDGGVWFRPGYIHGPVNPREDRTGISGTQTHPEPVMQQSSGIRFVNNAFFGIPRQQMFRGFGEAIDQGNTLDPGPVDFSNPPPRPPAPWAHGRQWPSLYAWQMWKKYGMEVD